MKPFLSPCSPTTGGIWYITRFDVQEFISIFHHPWNFVLLQLGVSLDTGDGVDYSLFGNDKSCILIGDERLNLIHARKNWKSVMLKDKNPTVITLKRSFPHLYDEDGNVKYEALPLGRYTSNPSELRFNHDEVTAQRYVLGGGIKFIGASK